MSTEYEPELLLADRKDLRRYHLLTKSYTLLIDNNEVEGAIAMDFHFKGRYVYWTDVNKEQIKRWDKAGFFYCFVLLVFSLCAPP